MKNLGSTTTASPTLASSQRRSWLKSGQHKGTVSEDFVPPWFSNFADSSLRIKLGFLPPSNLATNLEPSCENYFLYI